MSTPRFVFVTPDPAGGFQIESSDAAPHRGFTTREDALAAARQYGHEPLVRGEDDQGAAARPAADAISLLKRDHADVKQLFEAYAGLDAGAGVDVRRTLAEEIVTFLVVHAAIEREIFYPAARRLLNDSRLIDRGIVEHDSADALMARLQSGDLLDATFDACVQVLGEHVRLHFDQEEEFLFPLLLETRIDLDGLGEALAARQEALLSVET